MVTVTALLLLTIATLVAVYDSRLEDRSRILAASLATSAERQTLYLHEQKARVEAERLSEMKDEFLSTLSHELRTPLNAMLGWAQLLMDGGKDEQMLRRGLQTIERNARAQSQLIEDMLDMSRLIAGKVRMKSTAPGPRISSPPPWKRCAPRPGQERAPRHADRKPCRPAGGRRRPPAAGDDEPALERHQVHAHRRRRARQFQARRATPS